MAIVDGRSPVRFKVSEAEALDILRRLTQGPTPRDHERSSSSPAVPANDRPVAQSNNADNLCPHCGSEEWDRITDRTSPGASFNRCNRCEREWEAE